MRCKGTKKIRKGKCELAIFCTHTILFRLKKLKTDVGATFLPLRHIKHVSNHGELFDHNLTVLDIETSGGLLTQPLT